MKRRTRLLLTALFAAGSVAPCWEEEWAMEGGFSLNGVKLAAYPGPVEREMAGYRDDLVSRLAAGDYAGLDRCARMAREEKLRFANGIWKLHEFYSSFPLAETDPDAAWEARLAQIKAWQAATPGSATASIAQAEVYAAYAGKAHAAAAEMDHATDASPLHRQRFEAGLAALEDARSRGAHDPHYWRVAHTIAVGLEWPAANLDELYENATRLEPHYWSNEIARISSLLARNGGAPWTIEAFAAGAAAAADEYGEEIYARAAWEVNEVSGDLLEETSFDWPRVQAGYRALLRQHPNSTALLSEYCVLACRARDKAAARKCFVKLGGKGDLRAFKSAHGYQRHLRWANWN